MAKTLTDILVLNLRLQLEAKNIQQEELAKRAELSAVYISKLLGGKRPNITLETVEKIANGLEVTPAELLGLGLSKQFTKGFKHLLKAHRETLDIFEKAYMLEESE
jgi:transcriptional regulator with XRE-family HTH domain